MTTRTPTILNPAGAVHRALLPAAALCLILTTGTDAGEKPPADADGLPVDRADWPWWRGPSQNGIAPSGQTPPTSWSENEGVLWRTDIPGRGHGSPTVVGNQVFLAIADHDRQVQSVICYDRGTGRQRWETIVHRGGFAKKSNKKASLASSTVACDGERLFINFLHDGGVFTTALDLSGKQLWQTRISDYIVHQGYGSSPAIHKSLVIVSADNKGGGAIAGLDRASGEFVWKNKRPKVPNYASPVIVTAHGREQLVFIGCDKVASFAPLTGKELWSVKGATTECVTSTVTDGDLVFSSGGYPKNHVAAVRADGSGEIVWETGVRVYVPSMLLHDGYLYAVADGGVAVCWKAATGEKMWQGRLRGTFSSSPVMVNGLIYCTNESGQTFIFRANPDSYEQVARNKLGDDVFATPAICGSRIYTRVAYLRNGKRQEVLCCIGRPL